MAQKRKKLILNWQSKARNLIRKPLYLLKVVQKAKLKDFHIYKSFKLVNTQSHLQSESVALLP